MSKEKNSKKSEIFQDALNYLLEKFEGLYNGQSRDKLREEIYFSVSIECGGLDVCAEGRCFSFSHYGYSPLNYHERLLFRDTLAEVAYAKIRSIEKYKTDLSGTQTSIELETVGDKKRIYYSAPNGFYAPRQW